jgi:ribulose-5-phosphate 4-epimerase/fuculose-1-phosphate aldolase
MGDEAASPIASDDGSELSQPVAEPLSPLSAVPRVADESQTNISNQNPLSPATSPPSQPTATPVMPPAIGSAGGRAGGRASMGASSIFTSASSGPTSPRAAGATPTTPTVGSLATLPDEDDGAAAEMSAIIENLNEENQRLSTSLERAVEMVRSIDEPVMPPVVGDGFVIDSGQIADFVGMGRLLHADGLIRSSHGSLATLSPSTAGVMHGTRDGTLLPRLAETDLLTSRLGDAPPPGAGVDWRLHSVMLAYGALEYGSVCSTIAAHGPWTLAASLDPDAFVLDPLEAIDPGLGKVIIIEDSKTDPDQILRELKEALAEGSNAAIVVRGRVVLALGRNFDEAARRMATLEASMQLTMIARMAGYDA